MCVSTQLANIYSTEFVVETADSRAGLKYRQVFRNNMQEKVRGVLKCCTRGVSRAVDYSAQAWRCVVHCMCNNRLSSCSGNPQDKQRRCWCLVFCVCVSRPSQLLLLVAVLALGT